MIHFEYKNGYPENQEARESELKEMYKDIFEKYPDGETTFTWTGEKWLLASSLPMNLFLPIMGNDSIL